MHTSREDLPVEKMGDQYEGRFAQWGDYTAYFERIAGGSDFSPLFKGLPDDSCQSPHWGYLFKGRIRFIYRDRDEVIAAGQAYYAPPGHKFQCVEDAETVEFSPTADFQKTLEAVSRNLEKGVLPRSVARAA